MRTCAYCGYIFKDKWDGYEESYDDVTKEEDQYFICPKCKERQPKE